MVLLFFIKNLRIMTHASVFSGIGGPEVAATMLGWDNLFHCEINPFGRKVLDYWYPNSKSYEDITTTDFTEWRGRVDVLTGGFPCQPFSYAGRRRGAEDDRYLWPHMFRCIDEIRPTWVVAENVAGILTMVEQGEVSEMASERTLFDEGDGIHRYKLRETFTLQRICDDLESHGYSVQPVLIPAASVGAPHRRDRVFIIANANDRTNRRTAGEDESEGRAQRIQERHEVRESDITNKVRPASEGNASADSIGSREGTSRKSCQAESSRGDANQQPSERRAETERDNRLHAILRPDSDTEGECGQRVRPGEREAGESEQVELGGGCGEDAHHHEEEVRWYATNPNIYRVERDIRPRIGEQPQSGLSSEEFADSYRNIRSERRWEHFPTVPPVHRRNDGLPLLVDDLTLSFGKWRNEALKAYGNAIVPQVMYEIFRAIEQVENP